ncbi:hypothetical protein CKAN_00065900 [Cinnamomum micranthum f. kanehirae]|uniref:Uncharacterized protein n=1 Tax=Cinnamomum micranthum f. kanehirae TaxID=337451 RepID=A0A3S3N465_9MAGN|nr:hypothetical protein CKAN_00065900 [Cinnamomum micranthum f. kanehirae]
MHESSSIRAVEGVAKRTLRRCSWQEGSQGCPVGSAATPWMWLSPDYRLKHNCDTTSHHLKTKASLIASARVYEKRAMVCFGEDWELRSPELFLVNGAIFATYEVALRCLFTNERKETAEEKERIGN